MFQSYSYLWTNVELHGPWWGRLALGVSGSVCSVLRGRRARLSGARGRARSCYLIPPLYNYIMHRRQRPCSATLIAILATCTPYSSQQPASIACQPPSPPLPHQPTPPPFYYPDHSLCMLHKPTIHGLHVCCSTHLSLVPQSYCLTDSA